MTIQKDQLYGASRHYYTGGIEFDRFPEDQDQKCPQCAGACLRDEFPPNYWSSSGGDKQLHFKGDQKYICLHCAIQFKVFTEYTSSYRPSPQKVLAGFGFGEWVESDRFDVVVALTPLLQRDGKYLTPHDAWKEDYKIAHGDYPEDAWG